MAKRKYIFEGDAVEDLAYWSETRPPTLKKILELLREIGRTPFEGKGNPEPLKHGLAGYWSRRIDREHRIVYRIDEDNAVEVVACRGHYTR